MVTWGTNPGQSIGVQDPLPLIEENKDTDLLKQAYAHMQLTPGKKLIGTPIDVVFIGSCTNSRLSDIQAAAEILKDKKVNPNVKVLVVPGSQQVKKEAEESGLAEIIKASGAQWREAGCSMCLAMNPDKLEGNQLCASTSNRNFIGRQGSPSGRTLLMSPAMAAAAAVTGEVTDVREIL